MRIDEKYRPEAVTSKDFTRPQLADPFVVGGRLIATDGSSLVSLPAKFAKEEAGIEGAAVKAYRKIERAEPPPAHADKVIAAAALHGEPGTATIAFDAALLAAILEAFGERRGGMVKVCMTFAVPDPGKPLMSSITVGVDEPVTKAGAKEDRPFALLMPVKV